jgi:glycerol kinase
VKDLVLAIDQGTSGTKAVVFDLSARVVAKATGSLASIYPRSGFVEQDPYAIRDDVLAASRACIASLAASGRDARDIAAVGISNQRETFVLWDEAGVPLGNAVVWQCKRSVDICAEFKANGMEARIRAATGLIADPYFSGTKVVWLQRNDAAIGEAIDSGSVRFGTIDSWLLRCLSRDGAHKTDYTNASRTLFFDLAKLRWDEDLLNAFGLPALRLPDALPSAGDFGETDLGGILPSPVPISAMIGDSHAAAVGQGLFSPGAAKATLGTGSSILMNVGPSPVHSASGMMSTVCFSAPDRIDYALEGIIVSCGSPIKWMRDALGFFGGVREAENLARSVPDSLGVALVPAFSGMGAPYWRMDAKGAITGLSFGTTKAHIVRAAFEAAAFQIADVVTAMEVDGGVKLADFKLDGGMTENAFVMQLIADLLGKPVANIGIAEASALGAARLAALGVGLVPSLDSFKAGSSVEGGEEAVVYTPEKGRKAALDAYDYWKRAVTRVL